MILKKQVIKISLLSIFIVFLLMPKNAFSSTVEMLEDALTKIDATLNSIPVNIKRVAVYGIEPDKAGKINMNSLKDQLTTVLMDSGRFQVVDRDMLEDLMREQELSMSGAIKTTEMIKVGKLVGVQGFFYGSIEISEEKLILNLKLIDVTSSAIVYSKRFTGEAYASFTRLGIGWGYSTVTYGTTFEVYEGNTLLHQKEMKDLQASTMMYFILTYKQGFKDLKWAQFGVDFNFVQYSAPSNGEYEADFDANGINYTPGHELTVHFYSLKPRIYLSSKYILGWQHDWLNPYLGVAVNMISFGGNFHGAKDQLNPWQRIGGWEEKEIEADSYVVLTPIAGLEINLTKGLTLFAEGTFYINDAECQEKQDNYVAEMVMESTPYIAKGIYWNAGVKYYFTIF